VRVVAALVLFIEAAFLAYNLAFHFPAEALVVLAALLTCSLAVELIPLVVEPLEQFEKLRKMLDRLKRLTGLGQELNLKWIPSGNRELLGEVKGDCIFIYSERFDDVVETLVEEFVEYVIADSSKPYVSALNALIRVVKEDAYRRRDKVAKALAKLLRSMLDESGNAENEEKHEKA
jgi:hypothetical protein